MLQIDKLHNSVCYDTCDSVAAACDCWSDAKFRNVLYETFTNVFLHLFHVLSFLTFYFLCECLLHL